MIEETTVETQAFEIELSGRIATSGCCGLPPSLALSEKEAERLSVMFKAISHPVRVQMVELLSRMGGEICVCDIESQFDLSQPTISHHLKILRKAELIDSERRGQWLFYFARQDGLRTMAAFLSGLHNDEQ